MEAFNCNSAYTLEPLVPAILKVSSAPLSLTLQDISESLSIISVIGRLIFKVIVPLFFMVGSETATLNRPSFPSCIITDAWLSHVTSPTVVSLSSQKLIPVIPNSF